MLWSMLPLHHTHGLVNVTLCALANGARVEMPAGFDAEGCWQRLEEGGLTLFMAVPTVYAKLAVACGAIGSRERSARRCRESGCDSSTRRVWSAPTACRVSCA